MALSTYTYEQLGFGTELGPLTGKEKEALEKSWAVAFASDIFPYIDEKIFAPLYSERKSRRNVPVNVLAGAMLLQEIRGMSDEDLVEAAMFDLRIRTALHITQAVGQPFSLRTIQRFRTRLKRYREKTGEDLLAECLTGISGIGPKTALQILGCMPLKDLTLAIMTGDTAALSRAPGIGKKTAQRIALELKEKVSEADLESLHLEKAVPAAELRQTDAVSEAVQALVSLGYTSSEAARAVSAVSAQSDDAGELIRLALRDMSGR